MEPFAGGLAVLLAKERSNIEVLNDLDGDLVTFYRCVRFHTDPLLTELEFVLNSRREFLDLATQPGLTDIQRAARWFFRNRNCFQGGNLKVFGVSATGGGGATSSRSARLEAIRQLNVRLDSSCRSRRLPATWSRVSCRRSMCCWAASLAACQLK